MADMAGHDRRDSERSRALDARAVGASTLRSSLQCKYIVEPGAQHMPTTENVRTPETPDRNLAL